MNWYIDGKMDDWMDGWKNERMNWRTEGQIVI